MWGHVGILSLLNAPIIYSNVAKSFKNPETACKERSLWTLGVFSASSFSKDFKLSLGC